MNLYKQQILDHFKNPRNFGVLKDADVMVEETNASCGDKIKVYLKFKKLPNTKYKILDTRFKGIGCAISMAAASMLTNIIKGKSVSQIEKLSKDDIFKLLGTKIGPGRIRCATLALSAMKKGIKRWLLDYGLPTTAREKNSSQ